MRGYGLKWRRAYWIRGPFHVLAKGGPCLLYKVFARHLETFLQRTRTAEHRLPGHVEEEFP